MCVCVCVCVTAYIIYMLYISYIVFTIYAIYPNEYTKLIEVMDKSDKSFNLYKICTCKTFELPHINNEKSKKEIKETIQFSIATMSKNIRNNLHNRDPKHAP